MIVKIDVLVLIGGSFHTQHICQKEDQTKIEGEYLTIEVFRLMKVEARKGANTIIAI